MKGSYLKVVFGKTRLNFCYKTGYDYNIIRVSYGRNSCDIRKSI